MNRKTFGFTLIELMMVVMVIAILSAIAIPSYRNYMFKARRADAKAGLSNLQLDMEKYRAECVRFPIGTTTGSMSCATGSYLVRSSSTSPDQYYNLNIIYSTTYAYQLKAIPTGLQTGDKCGNYWINQNGLKWVTTAASGYNASTCW